MLTQTWWQDLEAEDFTWDVPDGFNIAADSLDSHEADKPAILDVRGREVTTYTFGDIRSRAIAMATWLWDSGYKKGDRVAVFLPQSWELVVAHCAGYYAGLVVVPLTTKFGPEAVSFRLRSIGARHTSERL